MKTKTNGKQEMSRPMFQIRFLAVLGISSMILSAWACQQKSHVSQPPPNIIILLIDALRADSLNDYGNARQTNPFLAEFGRKGVRFANAYSHSSHTKLSVASLFTGLIPPAHGVRKAHLPSNQDQKKAVSDVLSARLTTMAETLRENKYSTAAFVTNPHLTPQFGFSQGFSEYKYIPWPDADAATVDSAVLKWLGNSVPKPFFIYIHYMDVHAPYDPPPKYQLLYSPKKDYPPIRKNGPWLSQINQERIDYTRALYEAQINAWDDEFRSLVTRLESGGWLDNTLFIILSDHGEEFYDHRGFGHGYTLYEEELRVPLYFVYEGPLPSGQTRQDRVELIDIFPTIGHFTGIDLKKLRLHGRNLFSGKNDPNASERMHYAETCFGHAPRSVQTGTFKLVFNSHKSTYALFNLLRDPKEQTNIYADGDPSGEFLEKRLEQIVALYKSLPQTQTRELDPKTIELLKSLGYIK